MRLSARPLLDNRSDQSLFVGRTDALRRIEGALRSGLNCLVAGEPGSGKTSLVRAVMFRSHEAQSRLRFTYVRANEAHSAVDLLLAVVAASRAGGDEAGHTAARPVRSPIDLIDDLAGEAAHALEAEPGIALVIVVEDVSAAAGGEVFGALRDELWQVDVRWLVTTSAAQLAGLLRPPADVFFETRVELGILTVDEAAELLRRRLEQPVTPDTADFIATVTQSPPATPRRLLEVARELAAEPAVGPARFTTVQGLTRRAVAIGELSRPARMLAQELEALGWASASDERLLGRMGWTRPRVVQVIAELESRGVVQMREENTGRGRPRKLYRLTPPAQFEDPRPT